MPSSPAACGAGASPSPAAAAAAEAALETAAAALAAAQPVAAELAAAAPVPSFVRAAAAAATEEAVAAAEAATAAATAATTSGSPAASGLPAAAAAAAASSEEVPASEDAGSPAAAVVGQAQQQQQEQQAAVPASPSGSSPTAPEEAAPAQQLAGAASLEQQLQRQQQSSDSCPESAVPDSQLQQLSPPEVAGPGAGGSPAPTPQSRPAHRLSPGAKPAAAAQQAQQQQAQQAQQQLPQPRSALLGLLQQPGAAAAAALAAAPAAGARAVPEPAPGFRFHMAMPRANREQTCVIQLLEVAGEGALRWQGPLTACVLVRASPGRVAASACGAQGARLRCMRVFAPVWMRSPTSRCRAAMLACPAMPLQRWASCSALTTEASSCRPNQRARTLGWLAGWCCIRGPLPCCAGSGSRAPRACRHAGLLARRACLPPRTKRPTQRLTPWQPSIPHPPRRLLDFHELLLDTTFASTKFVPPGQPLLAAGQWRPVGGAPPPPPPPGETLRHNAARQQQGRRSSLDSLVLPQSAVQQQQLADSAPAEAPAPHVLPRVIDFGGSPARPLAPGSALRGGPAPGAAVDSAPRLPLCTEVATAGRAPPPAAAAAAGGPLASPPAGRAAGAAGAAGGTPTTRRLGPLSEVKAQLQRGSPLKAQLRQGSPLRSAGLAAPRAAPVPGAPRPPPMLGPALGQRPAAAPAAHPPPLPRAQPPLQPPPSEQQPQPAGPQHAALHQAAPQPAQQAQQVHQQAAPPPPPPQQQQQQAPQQAQPPAQRQQPQQLGDLLQVFPRPPPGYFAAYERGVPLVRQAWQRALLAMPRPAPPAQQAERAVQEPFDRGQRTIATAQRAREARARRAATPLPPPSEQRHQRGSPSPLPQLQPTPQQQQQQQQQQQAALAPTEALEAVDAAARPAAPSGSPQPYRMAARGDVLLYCEKHERVSGLPRLHRALVLSVEPLAGDPDGPASKFRWAGRGPGGWAGWAAARGAPWLWLCDRRKPALVVSGAALQRPLGRPRCRPRSHPHPFCHPATQPRSRAGAAGVGRCSQPAGAPRRLPPAGAQSQAGPAGAHGEG